MTEMINPKHFFLFLTRRDGSSNFMGPFSRDLLHSVIADWLFEDDLAARGVVSAEQFNEAECAFLRDWRTFGRDGRWKTLSSANSMMPTLSDPRMHNRMCMQLLTVND